jgi:phosphatidylglycerol:prolipoprotein diacylglycerol transferase
MAKFRNRNTNQVSISKRIYSIKLMLAYGIGRIGCHLSGDGDWGIINIAPKPHWLSWLPSWMWAFNFPHNVIQQGKYIPGCTDNYCNELVNPVFPTSFYEATICLLLFLLLWSIRRRIKIPGLMFSIFAILNGIERFLIENIKINARYNLMGLHFTQAEFISLIICFIGITSLFLSIARNKGKITSIYENHN